MEMIKRVLVTRARRKIRIVKTGVVDDVNVLQNKFDLNTNIEKKTQNRRSIETTTWFR